MLQSNAAQPSPHFRNGSATSGRHMSTGSLNIGTGLATGQPQMVAGESRFEGLARSPPGRQNTSHVPCKFFRQGACQAGKACPFSHDLASTTDNGNCKFGPKCANKHVLPDGRVVNYQKNGAIGITGGHLNIGGRVNPDPYHGQSSALTSSFIRAQGTPSSPYHASYSPFAREDDGFPILNGRQPNMDIPTIDTSYASHPGSNYGSPRDEDLNRFGLGLSPVAGKGLSVLDAPLPASFDSQGISYIARHGPIASSVPAKFGIDSPPGSVGAKDGQTTDALKNLHSSAFGDDTRDRFNGIAASPPTEQYYGKRLMHSQRFAKTKAMSASLPKAVDQDWEAAFTFEEDYLPETLRDLMTPQEKARRGSRNADEEGRPILSSGTGTPNNDTPSKFGSPSNASPSRWGPLFQQRNQQKEEEEKAAASRASAFGHVGSPLRNSSLHVGAAPSSRPIARPNTSGDSSPYLASPPRQSSMSIISQQLQRTRLSRAESNGNESGLHPVSATRTTSNPIGSGVGRSGLVGDRQLSSSSIGTGGSGRFTTPIDEEQGDFVFNMEGMEDLAGEERRGEKRNSGGWTYASGKGSPNVGPIGGRIRAGANTNGGNDAPFG
ncbi:hypothetical protein B7494_g2784 [Chlorociboria aeruginascens]|nr:hypothetical protein B7494_g2784 [Chlorociboria aeruginascens]